MTTADPRAARPRRRRLLRIAAATVALGAVGLAGPVAAPAGAAPVAAATAPAISWYEIDLYNQINGVRWLSGRSPIWWHDALGAQAQGWSGHMAHLGYLHHHPDLSAEASAAQASWSGVAEIVGRGPSLTAVLQGFLASPPHRAKLLGDWHAMGVGVVASGGELWVTVRFIR